MSAPSPEDFVGDYRIRQGSVVQTDGSSADPRRLVEVGRTITLHPSGSRADGDDLDFTLLDEQGSPVLGPFPCRYLPEEAVLFHRDDDYEGSGEPLVLQVSLYRDDREAYRSIYGVMVYGDPDNVGVWGADESG